MSTTGAPATPNPYAVVIPNSREMTAGIHAVNLTRLEADVTLTQLRRQGIPSYHCQQPRPRMSKARVAEYMQGKFKSLKFIVLT